MIRSVNSEDLDQILEIDRRTLSTKWNREHYQNYVNNNNAFFNVLTTDGKLVGFVLVLRGETQSDLLQIAVENTHRQKGFGSKLMDSIFKKFPSSHELFLEVDEFNSKAISFYYNLGFEKIGLRKAYYDNGNNALVLRKVI